MIVCLPTIAFGQNDAWREITTTRDVVEAYPQRMRSLIESLDLDRPGLEAVREAWQDENLVAACDALLTYYRDADTMAWLRDAPEPGKSEAGEKGFPVADDILSDVFRGFGEKGPVPRKDNGHLDWTHRGPQGDRQFSLRVNRHPHLTTLMRAYLATAEEQYLDRLDLNLRDWLIASGGQPSKNRLGTSHLEPGLRVPRWAELFFALQQEPGFHDATRLLLLEAIPQHGDYLIKNTGHMNWVSMTQLGALYCGVAWPEFQRADRWRKQSVSKLAGNAGSSVYPDGAQKELTAGYHMVALSRFDKAAELLQRAGYDVPERFRKIMVDMWGYTANAMRPDGTRPLNNDTEGGSDRSAVIGAAERYEQSDWLYIATHGERGQRPEGPPSHFFPWAGQLVSRSGYGEDAHWSFFDVGPTGHRGHRHLDHGHLSVTAFGRDILVDSGRFAYQGRLAGKFRRPYAMHTRGHNTILIDGQGQTGGRDIARKPRELFAVRDGFDFAIGVYDGPYEGKPAGKVRHTRATLYLRDVGWVVVDDVQGPGELRIEPLWHFHPACTVETRGREVVSTDAGRGNVRITPVVAAGADAGREGGWSLKIVEGRDKPQPQGWYSFKYGMADPAPCAVYGKTIDGRATFAWVLTPDRDTPVSPDITPLDAPDGVARMTITWPNQPVRTVTVVLDERALPVKLPDGRRLQARLLIEEADAPPRVALGTLVDSTGHTVAADPAP